MSANRLHTTAAMLADFSLPLAPVRAPTLEQFWRDPTPFDAERAVEQAKVNEHFNRVRDAGLRKAGLL